MPENFFQRLNEYYKNAGKALKGDAEAASIFPNSSDKGNSRESLYKDFLRMHLPSKCNIFYGGFLFGDDGSESSQLDIIITTDTAPKFDLFNSDDRGKSFAPVEGCLGVVSVKSKLDKKELTNALDGLAKIPATSPLGDRINPRAKLLFYEEWPYKVVYASNGIKPETILKHLTEYYRNHPDIPISRRPEIIHVAGDYAIFRIRPDMKIELEGEHFELPSGSFYIVKKNPDVAAFLWIFNDLQTKALASSQILYRYQYFISEVTKFSK